MKRVTPILLTAFSVFALSFSVSSVADNIDSDGFITFGAVTTEATPAAATEATVEVAEQTPAASTTESSEPAPAVVAKKPKAKKKVVKKSRKSRKRATQRANRAKRAARQKRLARAKAKRNKNIRRASSYRVRRGDTLYRISVKSGVKLNRLVRLNKLGGSKKNHIQVGQRIRLR